VVEIVTRLDVNAASDSSRIDLVRWQLFWDR
jgi:hypothetical protein